MQFSRTPRLGRRLRCAFGVFSSADQQPPDLRAFWKDRSGRLSVQDLYHTARLQIAAQDAEQIGVKPGDWVRITSRRGSVEAQVTVGDIEPAHVFLPFHFGYWDNPERARARRNRSLRADLAQPSARARVGLPQGVILFYQRIANPSCPALCWASVSLQGGMRQRR